MQTAGNFILQLGLPVASVDAAHGSIMQKTRGVRRDGRMGSKRHRCRTFWAFGPALKVTMDSRGSWRGTKFTSSTIRIAAMRFMTEVASPKSGEVKQNPAVWKR